MSYFNSLFPRSVYRRDFNAMEEIAKQLTAAEDVLQRLIRERRRESQNDLISMLSNGDSATSPLPEDELVVLYNFLLAA